MVPAVRMQVDLRGVCLASALALVVGLGAAPQTAHAQQGENPSVGGLPTTLPPVPRQNPRPAQGDKADQRWQTTRPEKDSSPTASFIESLKGNDATLQVTVGQGTVLTTRVPIEKGTIAVGDPSVIDFDVLVPNTRMIRLIGRRPGVTDLSIATADGQIHNFQVQVVYDLDLLRAQLRQLFPDAQIKLGQVRDHLVVEGQARSAAQVSQIMETLRAYLTSVHAAAGQGGGGTGGSVPPAPASPNGGGNTTVVTGPSASTFLGQQNGVGTGNLGAPQVINLLRVPGPQQVMLQVRVAELNRTGLREIGADLGYINPRTGTILGTQISNANVSALATLTGGALTGAAAMTNSPKTTAFGIFPSADFDIFLRALRENTLLTVLAEPNLVAMNGHRASFLAGGQFPVPVPQGAGGVTNNVTIEFKDFGVQLDFVPVILEDGAIRLEVTPEVSSIDFALGTTLVQGGSPVPGLNTRKATTTVEIREGETLAIAGLLQVQIDAKTDRIPGLGDLPYIGPMFSNTSHKRQEKELLILVSPQLVSSIPSDQVGPSPGMDVLDPNNLEFYLMNRIEGRTGRDYRSTTTWDDCQAWMLRLEHSNACGPVGFSE
ncbi:MAG: pilus assembly protein N-terminal domain-containing protein [Planctomycetia bacterium]|nr:pilus assembly protein N-terminal domain-containing protein [Planctomycetia bacterium]